jgi:hypothetical protein
MYQEVRLLRHLARNNGRHCYMFKGSSIYYSKDSLDTRQLIYPDSYSFDLTFTYYYIVIMHMRLCVSFRLAC